MKTITPDVKKQPKKVEEEEVKELSRLGRAWRYALLSLAYAFVLAGWGHVIFDIGDYSLPRISAFEKQSIIVNEQTIIQDRLERYSEEERAKRYADAMGRLDAEARTAAINRLQAELDAEEAKILKDTLSSFK
jgi:hypothetical protein